MLPATTVSSPAARHISPASAVTVDFPLVPVMPITRAFPPRTSRAKISTSPRISIPRRAAACRTGSRSATPGLATTVSIPSNRVLSRLPERASTCGYPERTSPRPGGAARLSAARTTAPRDESQRMHERPVSPSPRTRTFLPCQSFFTSRSSRLAKLQRGKAEEDQDHRDDPEAHDNLVLLPALQFVVVVQRRHPEDALARQLERADLDDHGERLHHEDAAHDQQHDFLS